MLSAMVAPGNKAFFHIPHTLSNENRQHCAETHWLYIAFLIQVRRNIYENFLMLQSLP
jgi:hypothetical protein